MPVILLFAFLVSSTSVAYRLDLVVKDLREPVAVEVAPGEPDRLYVLEQRGRIRVVENGKLVSKPFLDIISKVTFGGEQGLLGLAFHPNYASNKKFYLNYTAKSSKLETLVAEYKASTEKILLRFDQPYSNHNGGQLAFDSKGYLYIATGDGGSANDPHGNGQNTKTLLGKILRIDVDGGQPYAIPDDNPFAKDGGRKEIFAWGLRNPWRFSFDKLTGALFAGDVGQDDWEEIDVVERGKNYGWNVREGTHCFQPVQNCPTHGLVDPIYEYPRNEGISVTGGYVYRGKKMPALDGAYIYGDYGSGKIWALHYDQSAKKVKKNELLVDTTHQISSFGVDQSGEILVVSHGGSLLRLVR